MRRYLLVLIALLMWIGYKPIIVQAQYATATPPAHDTPITPYPTVEPHPTAPLPPYVPMEELPYCDELYDESSIDQAMPTKAPTADNFDDPSVCRLRPLEGSGEGVEVINPWAFTGVSFGPAVEESQSGSWTYPGILVCVFILVAFWRLKK